MSADRWLEVSNLNIGFSTPRSEIHAVRDVSFGLVRGQTIGIVGESGSGKSQTVFALMGLLARNGWATGEVGFSGKTLVLAKGQRGRGIRGDGVAMIFQDPMTSLNPYLTVGQQMKHVLSRHLNLTGREATERCIELLRQVRMPRPRRRIRAYPHELSGGMRQRVAIAMALSTQPTMLIADEPTTALDVTVQAQILDLIKSINEEFDISVIMISHDFGVIAHTCDRVLVMRRGRVVEQGTTREVLLSPKEPYTRALIDAIPSMTGADGPERQVRAAQPRTLIEVRDLSVRFPTPPPLPFAKKGEVVAVNDVSFTVRRGEILGIVGESGCGKSSMARAVLRLIEPSSGTVTLAGAGASSHAAFRERVQIVFQDPLASLDPRMTIEAIIREPLENQKPELSRAEHLELVRRAASDVSLGHALLRRYPHQLSGGQCQRVGIARALVIDPDLVVCDESVSALDVTVQAEILKLIGRLQETRRLAMLFISHDLAVIRQIADRVLVMYRGRILETGTVRDVYANPRHPYTQLLLRSVCHPDPDLRRVRLTRSSGDEGVTPTGRIRGCTFHPRCPIAEAKCRVEVPRMRTVDGADVACFLAQPAK